MAPGSRSAVGCAAVAGGRLPAGARATEPVTSDFDVGGRLSSGEPKGGIAVSGGLFCAAGPMFSGGWIAGIAEGMAGLAGVGAGIVGGASKDAVTSAAGSDAG